MCETRWDDSEYRDSCANQTGCTDCDESGFGWCHPTDMECKTVERDSEGNSKGWFRCEIETPDLLEGIAFKRICDNLCSMCDTMGTKKYYYYYYFNVSFLSYAFLMISFRLCQHQS